MLSNSLVALAGVSSALALSYHGPAPAMHKRALGAVEVNAADHLKRDFFGNVGGAGHARMARKVSKGLNRRASTTYSTTANYYATTGGYSACHTYFSDDDLVIALPTGLYPNVTEVSEYCGKTVEATNSETGKKVTLTVQDASWSSSYVTLPKGAFLALGGDELAGELAITFAFTDASVVAPSSTSAADVVESTGGAQRSNKAASKSAPAPSSSSSAQEQVTTSAAPDVKVAQTSAAAKVAAVTTTTTEAPTTAAPAPTTTTEAYDYASASKASADAAWASSSKAEADAAWASSSQAAAASSKADADAAWASSSSAAAAAASKSSADAAWAASSSSSAAAAEQTKADDSSASSGGSSGGSSGAVTGGFATYYLQNGVAGNCGTVAQESDKVVALPTSTYAGGSHCGQQVIITRTDNGKSVTATVRDSCPTCVNNESLDLSEGAFFAIATEAEGMVPISYVWA